MTKPSSAKHTTVTRICIVGAGPCGLAALQVLLSTPECKSGKWVVTVLEARERVGGIWNPSSSLPPLNFLQSPLYDSLTTNIPHPTMWYTTFPFPSSTSLFPPASTVQRYLESYASHFNLRQHIRFCCEVKDAIWEPSTPGTNTGQEEEEGCWKVAVSTVDVEETLVFDYFIVANGHFHKPRYPDIPGLSAWLDSKKAIHAAWYRRPADVSDAKKVVVLGNGPSGIDIATELSQDLDTKIECAIHSFRGASLQNTGKAKTRGPIVRFGDVEAGEVEFSDGSVELGIGRCILATGYQFSIPFLRSIIEESSVSRFAELMQTSFSGAANEYLTEHASRIPQKLQNSSYHLYPLAKHVFPLTPLPSSSRRNSRPLGSKIAFLGLLLRGTPFPLFEAQAKAVVGVLRDPEVLDVRRGHEELAERYRELNQSLGEDPVAIAKDWHRPTELESFIYRDSLFSESGVNLKVMDWEKDMWKWKVELRREWVKVVQNGEADELVRGTESTEDWVRLMYSLLVNAGCTC